MKLFFACVLSAALCGVAAAAPMTYAQPGLQVREVAADMVSSSSCNYNSSGTFSTGKKDSPSTSSGNSAPLPEPATLLLIGLGMGAAAFRRKA